jgi:hypothetical protein
MAARAKRIEGTASVNGDARKAVRFPLGVGLRVCWSDEWGNTGCLPAEGLNISESGAAFLLEEPLPLAAEVHIELPNSRAIARARVRSCLPQSGGWRIGVELNAQLLSVC